MTVQGLQESTTRHDESVEIKEAARRLGFDLVGIAPAVTPQGVTALARWLDAGYAGRMEYIERRRSAYAHPLGVLDGVKSLVMLATNYRTSEPAPPGPLQGRVSRYAWGSLDYHDLLWGRLNQLVEVVEQQHPGCRARGVVDTAPLLERDFARLAGLGWFGKNTMLINRQKGSWFFLSALLVDFELEYDAPHETSHCGTCTRCLEACPTDAFVEPYVLDARRCISYLTIELRDAIPRDLRAGLGEWVFGCDVCQDVCPWNRKAAAGDVEAFQPRDDLNPVDATWLLRLDDAEFRRVFRGSPLKRPKRAGILRNAAIVLGNRGDAAAVPVLSAALEDHEPLVRGAAAWALGQIGGDEARAVILDRLERETDECVRLELEQANARICPGPSTGESNLTPGSSSQSRSGS